MVSVFINEVLVAVQSASSSSSEEKADAFSFLDAPKDPSEGKAERRTRMRRGWKRGNLPGLCRKATAILFGEYKFLMGLNQDFRWILRRVGKIQIMPHTPSLVK